MENNEVMEIEVNNEVTGIEGNDLVTNEHSNELVDTMKKLGVAFGCGVTGAVGAALINVFVVPKVVAAIQTRQANKAPRAKKERRSRETIERPNVNPYSVGNNNSEKD